MTHEPLKGYWDYRGAHRLYIRTSKNLDKDRLVSQDCLELWQDVRSAVEWLKNKFINCGIDEVQRMKIIDWINEAFEDVIK